MEHTIEDLDWLITSTEYRIQEDQQELEYYQRKRMDLMRERTEVEKPTLCKHHGQPKGVCCDG